MKWKKFWLLAEEQEDKNLKENLKHKTPSICPKNNLFISLKSPFKNPPQLLAAGNLEEVNQV